VRPGRQGATIGKPLGGNGAKQRGNGYWRMSRVYWVHLALPDTYFAELGLQFPWTDPA